MTTGTQLEALITRDRAFVLACTTTLAWVYLLSMAADMDEMGEAMLTARAMPWAATEFVLMFLMWAIMMVAMMLPSAAPMILLFATVNRRRRAQGHPVPPTGVFAAGYVGVWAAFSLAATVLQWALHRVGLLSPMMVTSSAVLGGSVLIAAGIY